MAIAIQPTRFRIPLTEIQIELTALDKKVLSVALASLAFFALQLSLSFPLAFAISFAITTLTYLSEKYLRTDQQRNDWFNTNFDQKELTFWASLLILRPIIIQILCWSLGIPLPAIPQAGLAEAILAQPWRMIPIATIVAPVAEEILFRGVLLERLEDATQLLSRHTFVKLSKNTQEFCCDVIQAVVFGALHINQTIKKAMQMPLFLGLSFMGYIFALLKRENNNSLVAPAVIHSANNTGAVIGIFANS